MNELETELRRQLEETNELRKRYLKIAWTGAALRYDSIEDLILQHGRIYRASPSRPPIWIPKACFQLSYQLASQQRKHWIYCEGFAISETLKMAIHHAWCAPAHGTNEAYDSAWDDNHGEVIYLGIPFKLAFIHGVRKESKWKYYSVLDTFWNNFPLLTGAIKVENVIWRKEEKRGSVDKSKSRRARLENGNSSAANGAVV